MNVIDFKKRAEPAPAFRRDEPSNAFVRLITAQVLSQMFRVPISRVTESCWPLDNIIERAVSAPAMTSVAGWAAELVQRFVVDAVKALGPASAGAQLLQHGLVLSFSGAGSISAPGFVAEFGNAGWVAEGNPIPVRSLAVTPTILNPHKLGAIAVLTREMMESSNAESLIQDALMRAAGRMLDEVLFDANPEDAARPRGLRNGIAALTASSNTDPFGAAYEDVAALINALAPVAGNGPYVLIAGPGRAAMIPSRLRDEGGSIIVLGSSAVVNDLLAVAPAALVAAFSPTPDIETSAAAQIVMDTAPGAAGTTASPNKSMFQSDAIAIKMRWPATWALRDPRAFAWVTPTWK